MVKENPKGENKTEQMGEDVLIPNFNQLVGLATRKIEEHFDEFRNSWVALPNKYWEQRIDAEVQKIKNARSDEERQKYLLNLLNISAMNHNSISIRRILT